MIFNFAMNDLQEAINGRS